MATSDAPISIGSVSLIVNDLVKVRDFYKDALGLNVLTSSKTESTLGQGDTVLLKLNEDKQARQYPREAGLFHTAFLLPDRASLGSWLIHVDSTGVELDGAADHLVSEALYLTDPEGNGIEVYADRDRSQWSMTAGKIKMATNQLDLVELASAANENWDGMPDRSVIGHVHLQVGNVGGADAFYRDKLGFEHTAGSDRLGFYGSGGYHHHIGCNTWHSRGSTHKPSDAAGISEFELRLTRPLFDVGEMVDPWGLNVRLSHAA